MKTYGGSGCLDSRFLDLSTSWRWVVNFTPLALYPRGKSPRYPLDRRLGGSQSRSGRYGEVKILDPTGARTRPLCRPAHRQSQYRVRYSRSSHYYVNHQVTGYLVFVSVCTEWVMVYPKIDNPASCVIRAVIRFLHLNTWEYRGNLPWIMRYLRPKCNEWRNCKTVA
jgi:hypothetical protein